MLLLLLVACLPIVLVVLAVIKTRELTPLPRGFLIWAAIGFFVPLFWGILGFLNFNAHESVWIDIYWNAVYITCPSWMITGSSIGSDLLMMILNAALYGSLAVLIMSMFKAVRQIASRRARF